MTCPPVNGAGAVIDPGAAATACRSSAMALAEAVGPVAGGGLGHGSLNISYLKYGYLKHGCSGHSMS